MTESPKLLPCPFCGNKEPAESPPGCGVVYCDECGARTVQEGWWNRRTPDPEREAMARVCEAANAFMAIRHPHGDTLTTTTFSPAMNAAAVVLMDVLADLERAREGEG